MSFASFPYLVFLFVCVLFYFALGKNIRNAFLLLASYLFYATFGLGFVVLMIFTTLVTFFTARACFTSEDHNSKRSFLFLGIGIDLGVFILFKYFHFIDLDMMNWPGWSIQKLLIPVGISFYTFKTLGYCIDVYKGLYAPEASFVNYAASVSFFPQLIAGPIEKSHTIIAQLKAEKNFHLLNTIEGGKLILWGFFKKLVIADSIAQVINPVFNRVQDYGGLDFAVALLAFVYQIYADFSGYSDIAIGSAKCFGVELPPNFNKPFFSKNVVEFWGRWHISFSTWLREYVFTPLGGVSRSSKFRTVLNLLIVFLLVGLWHGASANYLLYAFYAFLWILMDIGTRPIRRNALEKSNSVPVKMLRYINILLMSCFLMMFFRPGSIDDSFFIFRNAWSLHLHHLTVAHSLYLLGVIALFELLQMGQLNAKGHAFERIPNFYLRGIAYIALLFLAIIVSSRPDVTFQYFQF